MHAALFHHADRLLRGSDLAQLQTHGRTRLLGAMVLAFAPMYGALMGSFLLDSPERFLQVAYSAVKLPLLLFGTSLVCLPGFFVLSTVLGLRDDLVESLRAILAGQAGLSIVLAAFGPLTRFLYFCDIDYHTAILCNAAAFALATAAAQVVTWRHYRVLIRRRPNHRITLAAWVVLYSFVGIQMGWILRPFIGAPGMAVTFLRQEPFSNAYMVVIGLLAGG